MPSVIFHLDGERGLRGGERQVLTLAADLRSRGHRQVIVCRAGSPLEREARSRKFEVMTLPFFFEWDPVSAWKLHQRLLKEDKPVVHAHSAHAAALAWLAVKGTTAKRVVHRRVDFKIENPMTAEMKYASADRVIAITRAVKGYLVEGGVPSEKIDVIPSSIDAAHLAKAREIPRDQVRQYYSGQFGMDWEAPWVGIMAALEPHKDVATFLKAAREVLRKRPKTCFLVVGDGSQRRKLERLTIDSGLGLQTTFTGQRSDNLQLLKAMDVFCLSSNEEGMGSVLLEAMACRVPIAATSAGGIPEVVEHGRNGLLSPPEQPKALAENILKLLEDKELAQRLVDEGEKRLGEFTAERMGAATEKVYQELLGA